MHSLQTLFEDGSSHHHVDLSDVRGLKIFDRTFLLRVE